MLRSVVDVGGAEEARFGHQGAGLGWNDPKQTRAFVNLRELSQELGI
jgi:hypothetical protein